MRAPRSLATAALLLATACAAARPVPARSGSPMEQALEEAQGAMRAGRQEEGFAAFRRAQAADPRSPVPMRMSVEAHFRAGRLAQVLTELEAACAARPDDDVVHYGLGLAYYARAQDSEGKAVEHLSRACALRPDLAEYHFRLGVLHLEAERFPEAVESLKRARDLEPTLARHHVPLALGLSRTGDRRGAVETIRTILTLTPDQRDLDVARGVMARITDPFREFPKAIEGEFQRGLDYMEKLDSPQQAIVAFEDILERFPDLAVVHSALGLAFQRLDDSSRAMDEFRLALDRAPDDPRNHLYIADLYFAKERFDRASEGYKAVLQRDPLSDRAYERLGAIALRRGNPEEAAGWLRSVTVLHPDDLRARQAYAAALFQAGGYDAASREFEAVLKKEPKNVEAMLRLALVDVERSRREANTAAAEAARGRAIKRLEEVLDLQPQNVFAARTLQQLKP